MLTSAHKMNITTGKRMTTPSTSSPMKSHVSRIKSDFLCQEDTASIGSNGFEIRLGGNGWTSQNGLTKFRWRLISVGVHVMKNQFRCYEDEARTRDKKVVDALGVAPKT